MEVRTRAEAIALGHVKFYPETPCRHGHIGPWFTRATATSPNCIECKRSGRNPEKKRAVSRAWAKRAWDRDPERLRQKSRTWTRANPDKKTAIEARRRARRLSQLCGCCTPAMFFAVYSDARAAGLEVDHDRPLALGGLHCCHNLQLLTPADHMAKTRADLGRIAVARRGYACVAA